jgi:hypothetical protein
MVLVGAVMWAAVKADHLYAAVATLLVTVVVVAVALLFVLAIYKRRRGKLLAKYGDPVQVTRMMQRVLWLGESADQVRESLGAPASLGQKARNKAAETWKYEPARGRRVALRVFLEDGVVTGWQERE